MTIPAVVIVLIMILLNHKKGWSFPTKKDIDWANKNSDLIERN